MAHSRLVSQVTELGSHALLAQQELVFLKWHIALLCFLARRLIFCADLGPESTQLDAKSPMIQQ
jgi:hypothetical protein